MLTDVIIPPVGGITPPDKPPMDVALPAGFESPIIGVWLINPLGRFGTRGWVVGACGNSGWLEIKGVFWASDWDIIGAILGGSGRGGIGDVLGSGGIDGGVLTLRDAKSEGGRPLGISNPLNFKFINLHAIENSFMSILPSASVSARAL